MRLPYIDREQLPPEDQATFDRIAATRGDVLNVFRTLANSPGALKAVAAVGEFIRYQSSLDPIVRELCILLVARRTQCIYEWTQHMRVARSMGIAEDLLQAVATGRLVTVPGKIGLAARFVNALIDEAEVDDALFATVLSTFDKAGTVDLAVLTGYYRMLAGILNVFKVQLEPGTSTIPF